MRLSSIKKFNLVLILIFHLHFLVSVGKPEWQVCNRRNNINLENDSRVLFLLRVSYQNDNEVMTKEFTEAMEKWDEEPPKEDEKSIEILPLEMWHLTPALVEEARRELGETEEVKQKALVELRRMIEAEENLVSRTDDLFLLAFLRKKKFDVAKAFRCVQDFWIFRGDYEDIFAKSDTESSISFLEKNITGLLKYRDREGCTVVIFKLGMWEPEEYPFEFLFIIVSGILTYSLEHEATQVAGYRVIVDLRGLGWKQLSSLTPSNIYLAIRGGLYTFPGRFRSIHLLGETWVIRLIWNIAYPFLPAKMKKLFVLHGEDFHSLQDFIHPSVLPGEYGGSAPPFANDMDRIRRNCEKITKHLHYGYKN